MLMIELSCYLSFMFLFSIPCGAKKVKRVMEGELIEGRDTGYDAVRYLAVLGSIHTDPWYGQWNFLLEKGWYGFVICGGALVTPQIVQTACHCLSTINKREAKGATTLVRPTVAHHWEKTMNVYVGVNHAFGDPWAMDKVEPLMTKAFVVDQRCALLPKGTLNLNTHDFGWVTIETFLAPKYDKLFDRVSFAPLYSLNEIETIWKDLMFRQPVCLNLGFGDHIRKRSTERRNLLHGWARMMTYSRCMNATNAGLESLGGNSLVSWICTVPFPRHNQSTGQGDSGGPTTCNNLYVALVMGGKEYAEDHPDPEVGTILDQDSAIAFVLYQNAMEYRRSFIQYMQLHGKTPLPQNAPTFNPFVMRFKYRENPPLEIPIL